MNVAFAKLVEVIHYICDKAASAPEELDQIKLNKILWYSDAQAYMTKGSPITRERYIKKPFGPVARRNRLAVEDLEHRGILRRGRSASGSGFWNTHFDVIENYDIGSAELTTDEREVIDKVYSMVIDGHTSMTISERSHGEIWQLADNGEDLPLFTVFAETLGEVSDKHMVLAREGLEKLEGI